MLRFFNKRFTYNLFNDFKFFSNVYLGKSENLIDYIIDSEFPISFSYSPSLYFQNNKEENINNEIIISELKMYIYHPMAIIKENKLIFLNLNNKNILYEYNILEGNFLEKEPLILKWNILNTIYITNSKMLLTLYKFCNEKINIGIPINAIISKKIFEN